MTLTIFICTRFLEEVSVPFTPWRVFAFCLLQETSSKNVQSGIASIKIHILKHGKQINVKIPPLEFIKKKVAGLKDQ